MAGLAAAVAGSLLAAGPVATYGSADRAGQGGARPEPPVLRWEFGTDGDLLAI